MADRITNKVNNKLIVKTPEDKLKELLCCGDERIELSAAKELLAMENKINKDDKDCEIKLDVTIRIV